MDRHPIESLMGTTMENIRDMVDVNTVVGDPVETADGVTIVPISRVSFGFVAGGGEYSAGSAATYTAQSVSNPEKLPFAGGSGAGVSVQPMGFLIVSGSQVKLLSANCQTPIDRVVELIPQMIGDLKNLCDKDEGENKTADDSPSLADQYAFTTTPNHAADAVMKEIRPEKPSDPH